MEDEGRALLTRAGVAAGKVTVARIAEMRYLGQGHEVEAAVAARKLSAASLAKIRPARGIVSRALQPLAAGRADRGADWRVTVVRADPKTRLGGQPGRIEPDAGALRAASR